MPRPTIWQRLRDIFSAAPEITPEQLTGANPTRRWRSVRALAAAPRPALLPHLLPLLADPDPIVRDETVRTLASWGSEHSLKPALDLLSGDPSPELATSLLDLLAALAAPDIQHLAAPHLTAPDPLLRTAAARALGAVSPGIIAPALLPLTADPDPRVRRAACQTLGRLADPSAVSALSERLRDLDTATQQHARAALTRIEAAQKTETKQSTRQPSDL